MGLLTNNILLSICIWHLVPSSAAYALGEFPSIRPVPCHNRMTGESGVCTFNWSCLNVAHGVHIGPCVDRFFVGSCCKIPGNGSHASRRPPGSLHGPPETLQEDPTVEPHSQAVASTQRPFEGQEVTLARNSSGSVSGVEGSDTTVHDAPFAGQEVTLVRNSSDSESDVKGSVATVHDAQTVSASAQTQHSVPLASSPASSFSRKPVLQHTFLTTVKSETSDVKYGSYEVVTNELSTDASSAGRSTVLQPVDEPPHKLASQQLELRNSSDSVSGSQPQKDVEPSFNGTSSSGGGSKFTGGILTEEDSHHLSFILSGFDKDSNHSSLVSSNTFLSWAYNFITNWNASSNANATGELKQNSSAWQSPNSAHTPSPETESSYQNTFPKDSENSTEFQVFTSHSPDLSHFWQTTRLFDTKDSTITPAPTPGRLHNLAKVCGRPQNKLMARIVGGRKSHRLRWPWMISLRRFEGKSYKHKCGAALLNQLWAITAAHCVDGKSPNDVMLRLGEHNFHRSDAFHPHTERRIYIMVIHPEFDPTTYENDLALLRFYEPVRFRANIGPVCLPKFTEDLAGRTAVVTGWGRLSEEGALPGSLHEVHMPIITNKECEEMYSQAGYSEAIRDVFMCAGLLSGGLDACEGDSGGPMVVKGDKGQWTLVGLISWGMGCAAPRQPGVYTRISKFVDWIDDIIAY